MPDFPVYDLNTGRGKFLTKLAFRSILAWPTEEKKRADFEFSAIAEAIHRLSRLSSKARLKDARGEFSNWFNDGRDESEERERLIAEDLNTIVYHRGGFLALSQTSNLPELKKHYMKRHQTLLEVGQLIAIYITLINEGEAVVGGASIDKAAEIVEALPMWGRKIKSDTLRKNRRTFQSVAHLCAAYQAIVYPQFVSAKKKVPNHLDDRETVFITSEVVLTEHLEYILALSNEFLTRIENYRNPHSSKGPLLTDTDVWRVRKDAVPDDIDLTIQPLSAAASAVLKSYTPRKRS